MDIINNILPAIEHFRMLGYWAVLLVAFLESLAFVGIVVPGALLVVLAGSLAAKGYFDIGDLVWFATVGAILGDGISFRLGGRSHLLFREENRLFKPSHLERGKEFFARHGGVSVFLARFIGPIRAVVPFVAGLSGMDAVKFSLWNVTGAVVWSASHLLAGYFLGEAWRAVEIWATRFGILLAAILLLALCGYLLKRFFEKRGRYLIAFAGSLFGSLKEAIVTNPEVRRFVENHPTLFAFVGRRLDRSGFSGLPLTLLGVVFIYVLLLLGGVVEDLLTADPIIAADTRIDNLLYAFRDPLMVKLFLWITLLAKPIIILSFSLLLFTVFLLRQKRVFILPLLVTLAGSGVFSLLGKVAFHRQRPSGIGVYTETSFSFPSGHATIAAAFYGFVVYYLWRQTQMWSRRLNILFIGVLFTAAIGFSRLYLGVHFLSDVLGGYLLGLLWLIIGISLSEWRLAGGPSPVPPPLPVKVRVATAAMLLACAFFYVYTGIHYRPALLPVSAGEKTITIPFAGIRQSFVRYRIPLYTETITGEKKEPLSFVVAAVNDGQMIDTFRKAGWRPVDPVNFASLARTAQAAFTSASYTAAPLAPSFWHGSPHEFGFATSAPGTGIGVREQARLWRTDLRTEAGETIYVGTASRSAGRRWWGVPGISPDIDTERERLFKDLMGTGMLGRYEKLNFTAPATGRNFVGDPFFSDGAAYVIGINP